MQIGQNSLLRSERAYSYHGSCYTGALFLIFSHQKTGERGFVKKAWRSHYQGDIKLRGKCVAELKALAFKPTCFRWYRCKTWSFHTVKPLLLLRAVALHLPVINVVFTPFLQEQSSCLAQSWNYSPYVPSPISHLCSEHAGTGRKSEWIRVDAGSACTGDGSFSGV